MVLMPKKVKHRKWQKGVSKGIDQKSTILAFGSYGLKSMGTKWITSRQLEACRRAIIRYMKRVESFGQEFFQTNPSLKKEQRFLWEAERDQWNIMLFQLGREE